MLFQAVKLPYSQTGFFSSIVADYLSRTEGLQDFYGHFPDKSGLEAAIQQRKNYPTNRMVLKGALEDQYSGIRCTGQVKANIELIKEENTFTITTAHQPNIFTGPLYFLYKILHAIKLADYCKTVFPQYNFVPVYYMGSEDADLDELGHIFLNQQKLAWNTDQTGAVGRMLVDKELLKLLARIESEVGVYTYGADICSIMKSFYIEGVQIQIATLNLVNELFGKYGLLVIVPDNAAMKNVATGLFKDELMNSTSSKMVAATAKQLQDAGYKVQAQGRDINLFYLRGNIRHRIIKEDVIWKVHETAMRFTEAEILNECEQHPDRFSPNVILRGLFQEMLLPNIAFIGGGGELAYWLQLKKLFGFYGIPYPLLVLRNSFLLIEKNMAKRIAKLGLGLPDLFQPKKILQDDWIKKNSLKNLSTNAAYESLLKLYNELGQQVSLVDQTLTNHVGALKTAAGKRMQELEKKIMRAEKRNYMDAMRQIESTKQQLFPLGNLQERIDNIIPYYAKWGSALIDHLYKHSLSLEQEFVILEELV